MNIDRPNPDTNENAQLQSVAERLAISSTPFGTVTTQELEAFIAGDIPPDHTDYPKVVAALANDTSLRERWQSILEMGVRDSARDLAGLSTSFDVLTPEELDEFISGRLVPDSLAYQKAVTALANNAGLREQWQARIDNDVRNTTELLSSTSAQFDQLEQEELDAFIAGQVVSGSMQYQKIIAALANDAALRERWQSVISKQAEMNNVVQLDLVRSRPQSNASSAMSSGTVSNARRRTRRWVRQAISAAAGVAALGLLLTVMTGRQQIVHESSSQEDINGPRLERSGKAKNDRLKWDQVNFSALMRNSLINSQVPAPQRFASLGSQPGESDLRALTLGAVLLAGEVAKTTLDPGWQSLAEELQPNTPEVICGKDCALQAAIGMWVMTMHSHCVVKSSDDVKAPLRTIGMRLKEQLSAPDVEWYADLAEGNCDNAAKIWSQISGDLGQGK